MDSPTESDDGMLGDMPKRPMRVKILYTFDVEHKTNCLARFQETQQIPVVQIDEASQVGVIELSRCIQAVTLASPELTANFTDNDFAIYAYDYSEHESPLVGQGMLSTAVQANQTSTRGAMITGRVCQNLPAIFNNGVKETLEVKLRLMPVRPSQGKNVELQRSSSPATSAGFDPNAWNQMQQNRLPHNEIFNFDMAPSSNHDGQSLINEIMGLNSNPDELQDVNNMGMAETPTEAIFDELPAHSRSAPGSRLGSPMVDSNPDSRMKATRHQSFSVSNSTNLEFDRPSSRASIGSESHAPQQTQPIKHEQLSPNYEEYQDDDGQARKRAKITQTDWRGRSSFGGKSNNLRVTASTAASMQMHRPVPTRSFAPGSNLEPPPRVPTPVPQRTLTSISRSRPSLASRSLLRQASTMSSDFMSDIDQMSDAIASSPEDDSPRSLFGEETPLDFPSSPPIFPSYVPERSPGTSTNSRAADSGYMSERNHDSAFIDQFGAIDGQSPEFEPTSWSTENSLPQQFIKREDGGTTSASLLPDATMDFELELPDDTAASVVNHRESSHSRIRPSQVHSQLSSRANSPVQEAGARTIQPRPSLQPARRSSLALPPLGPPNPTAGVKKRQQSQRASSYYAGSDAGSPAPSDTEGRPSGPRRSGSGAPRRKMIKDRLVNAVANGEMPPYCSHCGAIETPTWRRLYVQYCEGKPSPLDYVEGEGETIGIEELDWDEQSGEVTRFVIRKSMKRTKDVQPGRNFKDIQLCNPCGLWFGKTRKMRPQDKWGRRSGTRRSRKNKEAGELTDGLEPQSDIFTDAIEPEDSVQTVPMAAVSRRSEELFEDGGPHQSNLQRRRPDVTQRHESMENVDHTRATKSSPVGFHGTQDSPIELDDKTPRPTRRLLFPSPRQDGQAKTLDNNSTSRMKSLSPSDVNSAKLCIPDEQRNVSIFKALSTEKENMPPSVADDLSRYDSTIFKTPQKQQALPRRSPRTLEKILKTPKLNGSSHSSQHKRKAQLKSGDVLNGSQPNNDLLTSPASARYFLRSTPTRLANTPGRSSQMNVGNEISPFSKQLADMLSNDVSIRMESPSRNLDFPDWANFDSNDAQSLDWDELLSSSQLEEHHDSQESAPIRSDGVNDSGENDS